MVALRTSVTVVSCGAAEDPAAMMRTNGGQWGTVIGCQYLKYLHGKV